MAIENRLIVGVRIYQNDHIERAVTLSNNDMEAATDSFSLTTYGSISVSNHKIVGSSSQTTTVYWDSRKGKIIASALNGRYVKITDYQFMKIDHIEANGSLPRTFTATSPDGNFNLIDYDVVYVSATADGASPATYTVRTSNFPGAISNLVGKYVSRTGTAGTYCYVSNLDAYNAKYYTRIVGYSEDFVAAGGEFNYDFSNTDIESISGEYAVGAVGDELTTDTLTVDVRSQTEITAKFGDDVVLFQNGEIVTHMFIESVDRNSVDRYTLHCVSWVGILDREHHYGGVYNGTTLATILHTIFNSTINCDGDVANIKVYGWLPYDTSRNNLHRLLTAYNVSMFNEYNERGVARFSFLGQDAIGNISSSDTYIDGSSTREKKPTQIIVREHSFVGGNTEKVKLFDNSTSGVSASNKFITFNTAPIERLETTEGLTATWISANCATVSGIGVLYGYPYFHNTYDLTLNTGAHESTNVVSITDDTLITAQNSQAVMDRLEAYYMRATTEKLSIAVNGEKCGRRYNITSAMEESINAALLTKMSMRVSTFTKADCELISNIDYANNGKVMVYKNVLTSTSSSGWTVPSWWPANTPIRVVLIGGGTGGDGGFAGEAGKDGNTATGGSGGEGGNGGNGGSSGRVYNVNLKVNPASVITYICGTGGSGGAASSSHDTNNAGSQGGNTSITHNGTSYSSVSGGRIDNGYVDFLTGTVYAKVGAGGIAGGAGGKGGDFFDSTDSGAAVGDRTRTNGESGENCPTPEGGFREGGSGGRGIDSEYTITDYAGNVGVYSYFEFVKHGPLGVACCGAGGGSGAVATSNGSNGNASTGTIRNAIAQVAAYMFIGTVAHGIGADGVQPSARSAATVYGAGGDGGHGGSGGGGAGAAKAYSDEFYNSTYDGYDSNRITVTTSSAANAWVGDGGNGGVGGNGAQGCVIIYSPYSFETDNTSAIAGIAIAGKAIVSTR